ncbi:unnamed protein product [Prunus armeniaca]
MGWAAVKGKLLKLPPVFEFQNQASKALRKDSRALGSVLREWHVAWEQNQHEFSTKRKFRLALRKKEMLEYEMRSFVRDLARKGKMKSKVLPAAARRAKWRRK